MAGKKTEILSPSDEFDRDFGRVDKKLLAEIEAFAISAGEFDTAKIQRRFMLKYSQMANIARKFEKKGLLGPYAGSTPRKVIISMAESADR